MKSSLSYSLGTYGPGSCRPPRPTSPPPWGRLELSKWEAADRQPRERQAVLLSGWRRLSAAGHPFRDPQRAGLHTWWPGQTPEKRRHLNWALKTDQDVNKESRPHVQGLLVGATTSQKEEKAGCCKKGEFQFGSSLSLCRWLKAVGWCAGRVVVRLEWHCWELEEVSSSATGD